MKHHEIPYLELADEQTTNIDIDGTTDEVLKNLKSTIYFLNYFI